MSYCLSSTFVTVTCTICAWNDERFSADPLING